MSEANAMKIVFNLAIVLCVLTAFCLPTTLIAAEVPLRERRYGSESLQNQIRHILLRRKSSYNAQQSRLLVLEELSSTGRSFFQHDFSIT